jgi:hypothetical protein
VLILKNQNIFEMGMGSGVMHHPIIIVSNIKNISINFVLFFFLSS